MVGDGEILTLAELDDGKISPVSFELLGIGKKLARELDKELSAVIIGSENDEPVTEMVQYADNVYNIDHSLLEEFQPELYSKVLEELINQVSPSVLLLGNTYKGADIGPRLSFRLETNLTTDCLNLQINDNGDLERTKQVYGGNIIASFVYDDNPQLVTIRPKVMDPLKPQSGEGEIIDFEPDINESMKETSIIERVEEEAIKLDNADAIVSGGRGIEEPEGFEELKDLAEVLEKSYEKVEIGASRPPVDLGWVHSARQIGLTGEKVTPELYIATGISGATQHLVGMSNSNTIVAINKDPNAAIFEMSDYGIVAEYEKALPPLKRKLEELI